MLHKKLIDIQKEKEIELQQRNNMIAHFKDQLQEMKAKTDMEGKYLKKSAEVTVAQTQKKCTLSEKAMQDEIEVSDQTIHFWSCKIFLAIYALHLGFHQYDVKKKSVKYRI